MTVFVALLRAVNLAGHNRVAMAELRGFCEALGYEDVRTLLQSGNLVFRSKGAKAPELERRLETEAAKRLGLETDFFVRTAAQWKTIVDGNPFPKEAERDPSHLVVTCLKAKPKARAIQALDGAIAGPETARVSGRHAYIVYPNGIGRSKLTNAVVEKALGTRGTARNWNTVSKLATLTRSG